MGHPLPGPDVTGNLVTTGGGQFLSLALPRDYGHAVVAVIVTVAVTVPTPHLGRAVPAHEVCISRATSCASSSLTQARLPCTKVPSCRSY